MKKMIIIIEDKGNSKAKKANILWNHKRYIQLVSFSCGKKWYHMLLQLASSIATVVRQAGRRAGGQAGK